MQNIFHNTSFEVHKPRVKKGPLIGCGSARLLGFKKVLVILLLSTMHTFLAQNVHGGAEYVYVQKTMNDKAIIIRVNGNAYLIEKGVGCLSLWRYEGKTILINSPGIFLGVGSELLIPDLGQKCRIWNSQFLGAIKTPSSPPSTEVVNHLQKLIAQINIGFNLKAMMDQ